MPPNFVIRRFFDFELHKECDTTDASKSYFGFSKGKIHNLCNLACRLKQLIGLQNRRTISNSNAHSEQMSTINFSFTFRPSQIPEGAEQGVNRVQVPPVLFEERTNKCSQIFNSFDFDVIVHPQSEAP